MEIMTRSSKHEIIKCRLALLLGQFFLEKDISFRLTGSATLQGEAKGSSKEPDLSYYFGEDRRQRETPDLASKLFLLAELLINWNTIAILYEL